MSPLLPSPMTLPKDYASPVPDALRDRQWSSTQAHPELGGTWEHSVQDRRLAIAYARFLRSNMHETTIKQASDIFCQEMVINMFSRLHKTAIAPQPEGVYEQETILDFALTQSRALMTAQVYPASDSLGFYKCRGVQYQFFTHPDGWVAVECEDLFEKVYTKKKGMPAGALALLKKHDRVSV